MLYELRRHRPGRDSLSPMSKGYNAPVLYGAAQGRSAAVFPKRLYRQPDAVCTAAEGRKEESGHLLRGGSRGGFPTDHHPRAMPEADRLTKTGKNLRCCPCRSPYTRASHWRGLRPDMAGHQSGRSSTDGTPQYAVQRHNAQGRDKGRLSGAKSRTVDFCDTLTEILRAAKVEQHKTVSNKASFTT